MTNEIKGIIKPYTPLTGNIKEGGSGGTSNYEALSNKPKVNGIELTGNKEFEDLGLVEMSNQELLEIANIVLYGGE